MTGIVTRWDATWGRVCFNGGETLAFWNRDLRTAVDINDEAEFDQALDLHTGRPIATNVRARGRAPRVFVGGIPPTVCEFELLVALEKAGPVVGVIRHASYRSAHVDFKNPEDVDSLLSGVKIVSAGGYRLRVLKHRWRTDL